MTKEKAGDRVKALTSGIDGGRGMAKDKKKLGEILIEEGLLNEDSLANALAEQRKWGGRLGSLLIRMGLVREEDLAGVLERQLSIRCITLQEREVDKNGLKLLPVDMAKQYTVFPVRLVGKTLTLAMVDPLDIPTIDDLQFRLGVRIVPALALESEITRAIAMHYEGAIVENFAPPVRTPKISPHEETKVAEAFASQFEQSFEGSRSGLAADRNEEVSPGAPKAANGSGPPSHKEVLEALVRLLIDKGVINRDELLRKLGRD